MRHYYLNSRILFLLIVVTLFFSCNKEQRITDSHQTLYKDLTERLSYKNQDSVINVVNDYSKENGVSFTATDSAYMFKSLGLAYMYKRDYRKSLNYLLRTDSILTRTESYKELADVKPKIIIAYSRLAQLDKALEVAQRAEVIAKSHAPEKLADLYGEFARVYYYLDRTSNKAVMYLKKASDNALKYGDTTLYANMSFRVSTVYTQKKMIDSSLYYLDNAINILEKGSNSLLLSYAYTEKGNCYGSVGFKNRALRYYKKSIELCRKVNLPITTNLYNCGSIYMNRGKTDSALYFYKKVLRSTRDVNLDTKTKGMVEHSFKYIADIYISKNRPYKALQAYKDYIRYRDDVYNDNMHSKLAEIETKYQTEIKQAKIDKLEREMDYRKQVQVNNAIIIVALILIIAFVIFGFIYYSRAKAATRDQEQFMLEQRLLRSQMNPHFILNTFTTIQSFISGKKLDMAERYLVKFSRLLRLSLDNSIEEYVSLEEETEAIINYLELQKMRFDRMFEYEIDIDDNIDSYDILIPPMLIQPFVENSVEHGFKGVEEGGKITISVKKLDGVILCKVDDNGCGLNRTEEEKDKKKPSHSINITKRRFSLLDNKSSNKFSVDIHNKNKPQEGSGVLVVLTIPFKNM
ncbi:MAG: histidine kinase [Bacteroidales bacterium]|nr:histidine kinase [Bacteroidales bacterium]